MLLLSLICLQEEGLGRYSDWLWPENTGNDVRILAGARDVLPLEIIQSGSCIVGSASAFSGGSHPPQSSVGAKNEWSHVPIPIRYQGAQETNLLLLDFFMDTVSTEEVMLFRFINYAEVIKEKIRRLSEETDVAYLT